GVQGDPAAWFLSGAIHAASRARAEADWADLMSRLSAATRVQVLGRELAEPPTGAGILQGEPTTVNLASIRSGLPASSTTTAEPGFAWLCPTLPFDGARVQAAIRVMQAAVETAQMPLNVSLMCRDMRVI